MSLPPIWPALLRAGAFGAVHGAHPGEPRIGLTVSASTPSELSRALAQLGDHPATLLVAPQLAAQSPDVLAQASHAGHEIAGLGRPENLAALEVAAGQPLRYWALENPDLTRAHLQTLRESHVLPLPVPDPEPRPGGILRVGAADLPTLLPELRARAYQPVPLRDLNELRSAGPRDLFNHLYQRVVEDRYAQQEGMIDLSQRYDAVMRVAPLDHAPSPLPLPRHTPTAELHLNSGRLVGLASKQWLGTYRAYQRSLKDVAQAMQTHPELLGAQAVFAVTLFHGPLEKSGFTLLDLPPLRTRWYAFGFRLLRLAYGTTSTQKEDSPKMAWMPREEFLQRFG